MEGVGDDTDENGVEVPSTQDLDDTVENQVIMPVGLFLLFVVDDRQVKLN